MAETAVAPEQAATEWSEDYMFFQNSVTSQVFRVDINNEHVEVYAGPGTWEPAELPDDIVRAFSPIDNPDQLTTALSQARNGGATEQTEETVQLASEETIAASEEDTSTPSEAGDISGAMGGGRFRIPIVIPEGVPSGDRRQFTANSLEFKEPPMPLMWQKVSGEGHDNSVVVGRIEKIERLDSGGLGNAEGVFDTHDDAVEAERQVREKFLTSVSGDVDQFEAELTVEEDGQESITIHHGRLIAATLVAKPAFQEATIEFIGEEGDAPVILAAAGPLHPDRSWFSNPDLGEPTRLTVTDDGRVFGHIATWGTQHMGSPGIVPPRSRSNYKYFNAKPLRLADGTDIKVGQLTLVGGHADLRLDARRAMSHYDNTESAVADVVAGEDVHGIWVAGAMRPDVTENQIRAFRASDPSGDWRMTDDGLELVACCQVNVPGFPVARTMVASGVPTALVAAGASLYRTENQVASAGFVEQKFLELHNRLSVIERERDNALRANLLERLSKLRGQPFSRAIVSAAPGPSQ